MGLQSPKNTGLQTQGMLIYEPVLVGSDPPAEAPPGQMYVFDAPKTGSINTYNLDSTLYANVVIGDAFKFMNGRWYKVFHFGSNTISGLTQVHSDDTLVGTGVDADNLLRVAKPAAETGAEVNDPNVVRASFIDGDTDTDGSALSNSKMGFYNKGVQVQSGVITATTDIFIPTHASPFGADPISPGTDLSAINVFGLLDALSENGGAGFLYIKPQENSAIDLYVEAGTVTKVERTVDNQSVTIGYKLSTLSWKKSDYTPSSQGIGWNIILSWDFLSLAKNIIDLDDKLSAYVEKTDLEGKETDRYASYDNSSSDYWRGRVCFFDQASGAPNFDNAIRQPDIVDDTSIVIAFGAQLRTDKDPNNLQWAAKNVASDYKTGQVYYISIWDQPLALAKVTLTSGGTLTGTGDASLIYATGSLDEVNDIPDVQEVGNYFKIALDEPSRLDVRLSWRDILNAPWVLSDGTNVTEALKAAVQGKNEAKTLTQTFRVDATNVDYYASITLAGGGATKNTMVIRIPSSVEDTEIDNDLERLLLPNAWVRVGNYLVDITSNATRAKVGTSITYAFNFNPLTGTQPTGSTPVSIRVIGEDVHRGEIHRFAFINENWEDVLEDIGTPASNDKLLVWDTSTQEVKLVDISALP